MDTCALCGTDIRQLSLREWVSLGRDNKASGSPTSHEHHPFGPWEVGTSMLIPTRDAHAFAQTADAPQPISCYFCSRPASTMEAGYAVCEPMFHDGLRRRIEAAPTPEPDDVGSPAPEAPTGVSGHYDALHLAVAIVRAVSVIMMDNAQTAHKVVPRLAEAIRRAER